jgi:ubiquinone/menaquinone biosynthesis C-methylase UbiE
MRARSRKQEGRGKDVRTVDPLSASSTVLSPGERKTDSVKGQEWYQADDIAADYESKRFSDGGRLIDEREKRAVLSAVGPVKGKRMLEIACGTGRFTTMLAERGADIVGLDISPAMLQEGREKARAAGVDDRLEFMRGDAARLPFPDDHFETVIAMRFFHLADTPASFLAEMQRVARDQVVFDTFRRFSTRSIYNWLLPMGSRLYARVEVEQLLDGASLELAGEEHDFFFPYGLYRDLPGRLASPLREVDTAIMDSPASDYVASVSYWDTRLKG